MTEPRGGDWIAYRAAAGGVEWADAFFAGEAFSPHRHDTYAIGRTTHGVQSFTYRGTGQHARPGEVFVLHPDEVHDGRPGTAAGYGYRISYIAPELIARAAGRASPPFVADAVSADPRRTAAIAGLLDCDETDDLDRADALARLADALCGGSDRPSARRRRGHTAAIERLRERLADTATRDDIDLGALENEVGLDRFAIARHFRRAYGVSPRRFVILRRLARAKEEILNGAPLAHAAFEAGFADQSHMTRHFRNAVGMSPGAWRDLVAGSRAGTATATDR